MSKIEIRATSNYLCLNGEVWSVAPCISQVCAAIGSIELVDGDFVIIGGRRVSRFRYFEALGISVLENIQDAKVMRITVHLKAPSRKKQSASPYGNTGERSTKTAFSGRIELNGQQLRYPLRFTEFPARGELLFDNYIALGGDIDAGVDVESGFVQRISFDFKE